MVRRPVCWPRLALAGLLSLAVALVALPRRAVADEAAVPQGQAPAPEPDPGPAASALVPEREQFLLREACRYLKLTPALAAHLLPIARQTERRRALFQTAEAQARRMLEGLPPNQQAERARITQALEEERVTAIGEITHYAAPQVARLFTREQIALAFRLLQGNPPLYTHVDPALVEAGSGFVQGGGTLRGEPLTYLRGGAATPFVDSGRLGAVRDTIVATAPERVEDLQLDGSRREVEELDGIIGRYALLRRGFEEGGKPFPQWVVETDDFRGLTSLVEPLARRLFTSPEWVGVLQSGLRNGFGAVTRVSIPAGSGRLVRDYRMERGLRDLSGHGPELEPLGGQVLNGLYQFASGQGLHASDLGVTDHYSIELIVRYMGGSNYQKVIDFRNLQRDIGLYYYQGRLDFYQMANGGAPQPGIDHRIRLERNRATRIVRGFQDDRLIFSFLDLDDEAVFENGAATFFVDDKSTSGSEQGPGALTSILVWAGPANR